jgi:predicted enzyme related to lactoylglutathione lyase
MAQQLIAVVPVLMSRDVSRALAFYAKLGFTIDFQDDAVTPRYAGISRDSVQLHLQWQEAAHWNNKLDRPMTRFLVQDLDALHAEFVAQGFPAAPRHRLGHPRAAFL